MPFCNRCGGQVSDQDQYCRACGGPQPVPAGAPTGEGISPRTACVLCYLPVVGWIAAIVVLAAERFRRDRTVRFHAFQGLYLFVAWLIIHWVVSPISLFHWSWGRNFQLHSLLHVAALGVSIFMMVKASHGEKVSLPLLGELAEKSIAET